MRIFFAIILFQLLSPIVAGQTPLKWRDTTITGPQTFAMVVGISKYKFVRPLVYADKDAELFRDYLRSPAGGSVKDDNLFCLLNENAISSNFWGKGFQWLKAKRLQRGDRLFIYLAGHGDAIDEDQFFFLSYDCNPHGDKNNYLAGGVIQLFNLKKKIAAETAKGVDVFFIMDACRSNELPGGLPGQNFLNTAITEKRAGEIIMLATGAGQESLEDASIGNGHGLFTYYLVDGLTGIADSIGIPDNRVSFQEIQTYVTRNVPSVAEQRFRRKQDPYFCCNENSDKVVGIVDTAYLQKWLQQKRSQHKGTGSSFYGNTIDRKQVASADTSLLELYDRFYKAIKNKQLTGNNSAEYYYQRMNAKFPNDGYTLDAKSTLAIEFINFSEATVSSYMGCNDAGAVPNFADAGSRLQKAIVLLNDDAPDYTNSLKARLYFLNTSGNISSAVAFQNGYAAHALDPGAAYILNRLAELHLADNRADSALFYAQKAIQLAPNWKCPYTVLSLVYNKLQLHDSAKKYQKRSVAPDPSLSLDTARSSKTSKRKIPLGIVAGVGYDNMHLPYSNWKQRNIDYKDSLNSITAKGAFKFELGLFTQFSISEAVDWRPSLLLSFEKADIIYNRKSSTGGPNFDETVPLEIAALKLSAPLLFKLSSKKAAPYFMAGPGINILRQQNASATRLPIKSFSLSGEAGAGIDISFDKLIFTPEVKYAADLSSIKKDRNTIYSNTIATLKRQAFVFSIYLRRR
ncbi:MAG TPA: caspase family protein [Chitinophagaceae bacterium]